MTAPLLTARDLEVAFAARGRGTRAARAVDGVNLDVHPGEILALVGESGCGKTTLSRALVGLARPTAGTVAFRGTPLMYSSRELRRYRRHVQLILQDPTGSLNPKHTVYEAVAEGLRIHRFDAEERRVADALAKAGLRPPERFYLRYPHELSGGQRQRVMIAMALACDPELIIADESTTALDVMIQAQVLQLISGLVAERGIGLVMISHDLSVLSATCARLAVMYAGRMVEHGPSGEVLASARHPYTRALAAAFPTIGDPASRLNPSGLGGDPPDPRELPTGCAFHPRCPVAVDECVSVDVHPRSVAAGWQAACVHVPLDGVAGSSLSGTT